MKHLIAGVAILLITLGLCFASVFLLESRTDNVLQELRMAQQAIYEDNLPNAADCARNAQVLWDKHSGFYGVVLPQQHTEEIDRHFVRLLAAAQEQDRTEFHVTCAELTFLIDHLPSVEHAHYFNVL